MSRRIIRNIVVPVLQRMLEERKILGGGFHRDLLADDDLEAWLEKKLSGYFGLSLDLVGGGHCLDLERVLSEAIRSDPEGFKKLLERLLYEYVQQVLEKPEDEQDEAVKRLLEKLRDKAPPDRLRKQREEFAEIWR